MSIRSKRVTYNRVNSPKQIADFLKLLNEGNYSKKFNGVLNSISEINANLEIWERRWHNERGEVTSSKVLNHRKTELEREINAVLSRVRLFPSLKHILGWRTGYKYSASKVFSRDYVLVRNLMDAAATGLLDRVQKCTCGQWFHRRVEKQKYHSAKCREKAFKSTEEWKAYRREKARQYYRLHKSGKVK